MWKYGNKTIRENKAWTDDNEITHPRNWPIWSAAEKEAAGLIEVIPDSPPDSRLYHWGYDSDGVKIVKTAKSMTDINVVDDNGDPVLAAPRSPVYFMTGLRSANVARPRHRGVPHRNACCCAAGVRVRRDRRRHAGADGAAQ